MTNKEVPYLQTSLENLHFDLIYHTGSDTSALTRINIQPTLNDIVFVVWFALHP